MLNGINLSGEFPAIKQQKFGLLLFCLVPSQVMDVEEELQGSAS